MEKLKIQGQHGLSNGFMNTVGSAFKIMSISLVSINYIMLMISYLSGNSNENMVYVAIITAVSLFFIVLTAFIEPFTFNSHKILNLVVNILIALCCGTLFFTHKSYIILAVFFSCTVTVGLRLSALMSVVISLIYYGSYTVAMLYYAASGIDTLFPGVQILIILLSTVYLCQYLLVIEKRKISQEDAVADLLNEKVSLTNELSSKNEELEEAYWDMVNTLIDVIAAKDNFTGGHSIKVCEYSILLARKLELSKSDLTKILKASILHDIGKMGIPDSILLKPDALSDVEYGRIKSHPEIGCRILTRVKGLEDILPMILSHHERVDGKGYPNGLVSENIPKGAKIIAIADAYDAMTSNRPYRKALAKKEARKRLLEGAGTQFDAEYVEKFIEVIDSDNIERLDNYRKKDIRKIKEYAGIM